MSAGKQACSYAALILHDDGIPITAENISAIIKAANVKIESYWPGFFARHFQNNKIKDHVLSFAFGGDGAAMAVAGAGDTGASTSASAAGEELNGSGGAAVAVADAGIIPTSASAAGEEHNGGGGGAAVAVAGAGDADASTSVSAAEEEHKKQPFGDIEEPLVFNVGETQQHGDNSDVWEAYKEFISNMRPLGYWKKTDPTSEHHHIDVVLRTSRHAVRLRLCRVTFNIVGYQMEGTYPSSPDGQWLEFGTYCRAIRWYQRLIEDFSEQFIQGSSFLNLDYDYEDLLEVIGGPNTLLAIQLGQSELAAAVDTLAVTTDRAQRAKCLIVVSLMVCEGGRLDAVSDHFARRFDRSEPLPPELILSVGTCHRCMLSVLEFFISVQYSPYLRMVCSDSEAAGKSPSSLRMVSSFDSEAAGKSPSSSTMVSSFDSEAAGESPSSSTMVSSFDSEAAGKSKKITVSESEPLPEAKADVADKGEPEPLPGASTTRSLYVALLLENAPASFLCSPRPLVQVFSLRIVDINGGNSGYFYGTIVLEGDFSERLIYSRAEEEAEFVESGDTLVLTGPNKPITAFKHFIFHFSLKGEEMHSLRTIFWEKGHPILCSQYNEVLDDEFDGVDCTVKLCYVAYETAVAAVIEVEIVGSDNLGDGGRLWGEIAARCVKFGRESVLFRRSSSESVEVPLGEPLSLSRSIVAVSLDSAVEVHVKLHVSDEEIVNASEKFFPKVDCSSEAVIGGKVRVKITWQ